MSNRDEIDEAVGDGRRVFWKIFVTLGIASVIITVLGFALNSLGVFGQTVVEREVFEASYQRSESFKARIATDEAVLVEIESKLSNTNLDTDTRSNLEAQAAAARVRISTAKRQQ